MSQLLPIGQFAAAVVNTSNATCIYYQHFDGSIHELSGIGPVSSGSQYNDRVVLTSTNVRGNTPLASAVAAGTGLDRIKLYYIDPENQVRELLLPDGVAGGLDGMNYMAAPGSNMLYAIMSAYDYPRVGFQSMDAPTDITEASYNPNGPGWSATKATISHILPIGQFAAAVVNTSNATRIYYQHLDGNIHELSGTGPVSSGSQYNDQVVLTATNVRRDTPLASAVAAGTGLDRIKLYYIDPENQVRELLLPDGVAGGLDGMNYMAAPGSNMLYAIMSAYDYPRVGFQSTDAPTDITEASYNPNGPGWSATKFSISNPSVAPTAPNTSSPSKTPSASNPQSLKTHSSTGTIVGASIGSAIGLLLVAILLFCVIHRRRRASPEYPREYVTPTTTTHQTVPISHPTTPLPPPPALSPPPPSFYSQLPSYDQSSMQVLLPLPGPSLSATGTQPSTTSMRYTPSTEAIPPYAIEHGDPIGEYAAAHRTYISPELERKLRAASYFPTDDPDLMSASTWSEQYGVSQFELRRLRKLYSINQGPYDSKKARKRGGCKRRSFAAVKELMNVLYKNSNVEYHRDFALLHYRYFYRVFASEMISTQLSWQS